jgi:hypothetical protein
MKDKEGQCILLTRDTSRVASDKSQANEGSTLQDCSFMGELISHIPDFQGIR